MKVAKFESIGHAKYSVEVFGYNPEKREIDIKFDPVHKKVLLPEEGGYLTPNIYVLSRADSTSQTILREQLEII